MKPTTKHSATCGRVYRRYDTTCPRCLELAAGAVPRCGWGDRARADERRQIAEIRAHDCRASGCGPVCTFGDW